VIPALDHAIILVVLLPAMTAAFLVLALRHHLRRQRIVSLVATLILLALAVFLFALASDGTVRAYRLGDWPAPYGIVLVLDRLSAAMLLLTAALASCVLLYAAGGVDGRGRHFHPLFQFQLMGINGAFLTGDVFNLFVFFEAMLIASYGLMLHGGGPGRLKAGFQYVAINLLASAVFLVAVGLIYAVTGTLNMADLVVKVPQVQPADAALLKTGALLLFLVFATKAALVPLHWWLPATYAGTSAPSAAMFMIMTKVGAYAIIRVYGLVFGAGAGPLALAAAPFVLPAALATLVLGTVGLVGSRTLRDLSAFAVIASMGTLLVALGLFDTGGLAAGLYYLAHSTLAGAAATNRFHPTICTTSLSYGPLDGEGRRSIYLEMSIMAPPPFLVGFNLPAPKIPTGRRDVTSVPAQALILMNDPFVVAMADHWAGRIVADGRNQPAERMAAMFREALGREPGSEELSLWVAAAGEFAAPNATPGELLTDRAAWKGVAHALFNTKEFIHHR
jgi:NADH:ubiquinone oxidoreductase subunit 2 (subunit N)